MAEETEENGKQEGQEWQGEVGRLRLKICKSSRLRVSDSHARCMLWLSICAGSVETAA